MIRRCSGMRSRPARWMGMIGWGPTKEGEEKLFRYFWYEDQRSLLVLIEGKVIKLSVKSFTSFMTSNSTTQRKILRTHKYPSPEAAAKIMYYSDARNTLRDYHVISRVPEWLESRAQAVEVKARAFSGQKKLRLLKNAAVIRNYIQSRYVRAGVISTSKRTFKAEYGQVIINITPDLCFRERGTFHYALFNFADKPIEKKAINISLQLLFEIGKSQRALTHTNQVEQYDLKALTLSRGARQGARISREIEDACQNIEAIWARI
jgi:hypothetical protein